MKQEKMKEIEDYFNNSLRPEWLEFSQIREDRWANASVSIKSVQESIDATMKQIKKQPRYAFRFARIRFRSH